MRVVFLIEDSLPNDRVGPELTPTLWSLIEQGGWHPGAAAPRHACDRMEGSGSAVCRRLAGHVHLAGFQVRCLPSKTPFFAIEAVNDVPDPVSPKC